ncbi:MAG: hypothetical protein B6I20_02080 [Bacteroidetes bacterium 4572_117]|nr:MAG: hypothetical protein B6I20_02080 [Bacteroidetes bacterium 4572_117]
MDWLDKLSIDFFRFNEEDEVENLTIVLNDKEFYFNIFIKNKGCISSEKIKAVYYRGGQFFPARFFIDKLLKSQKKYLKGEWEVINAFFLNYFETLPYLGSFHQETSNNKITNLLLARKFGLKIPSTIVTSNLKEILKTDNNFLISKALKKEVYYEDTDYSYFGEGTIKFAKEEMRKYTNKFFPSQFQNAIVKQFELRVFFINKKTYTMAIIPLSNKVTQDQNVDYRIYGDKNLTNFYRNIPFSLPFYIEKKLSNLMQHLNLKIASIDFIINRKGEYIFLEINPVGQYHWVSFFCNYNLDKEIAIELKNIIDGQDYQ